MLWRCFCKRRPTWLRIEAIAARSACSTRNREMVCPVLKAAYMSAMIRRSRANFKRRIGLRNGNYSGYQFVNHKSAGKWVSIYSILVNDDWSLKKSSAACGSGDQTYFCIAIINLPVPSNNLKQISSTRVAINHGNGIKFAISPNRVPIIKLEPKWAALFNGVTWK